MGRRTKFRDDRLLRDLARPSVESFRRHHASNRRRIDAYAAFFGRLGTGAVT
jgi:hypothetical protein